MREDRQRLDKWLWFARFAKTRTLAAKLVASGFVRLNGQRTDNPAKAVAVGDVITIALARATLVIRVEGLGERRGPAPEARQLYLDLSQDNAALVSDGDNG
ncbi:RNA-binding S4 domain-containing protein [Microvirga tunisiensis]|jgi:ribosome-associated heat shock protein Hsp15|uniref:RNA-binding S4 domain-containing protein n=1 Tax=Microvirga tunisiensis TaxID=2108360 RepID=A0A5N7MCT0_9HYPH|nr:RNA-binding S4 domain-containing protein [Microvirga tunisiensis]MPR06561.1 RNA-binding S4 domain-containing protein [Microvirga tunisiensis]MPR24683.1 RNA-binding S4 domain-containing protein [Microvirga tunisiensis]